MAPRVDFRKSPDEPDVANVEIFSRKRRRYTEKSSIITGSNRNLRRRSIISILGSSMLNLHPTKWTKQSRLIFAHRRSVWESRTLPSSRNMVRYLKQSEAINVDKDLFEKYKFSVDQLMELAGQSCAVAVAKCYPLQDGGGCDVLVCCGPGNNGGDGLVCARHLALLGYKPQVYYPKRTSNKLYENLLHQCRENDIKILGDLAEVEDAKDFRVIVDALFGFSFKPPVRPEFVGVVDLLKSTKVPVCSVDVPSGWDVETGPPAAGGIEPAMLVSLTAPKLCARSFRGAHHYLGGRFVPRKLELAYGLDLPAYPGTELVVKL